MDESIVANIEHFDLIDNWIIGYCINKDNTISAIVFKIDPKTAVIESEESETELYGGIPRTRIATLKNAINRTIKFYISEDKNGVFFKCINFKNADEFEGFRKAFKNGFVK